MATKLRDLIQDSNISYDSFDLKIPTNRIHLLNDNLIHHWELVNTGTGEVSKKSPPSDTYKGKGYQIVFKIENVRYRNFDTGTSNFERCLIIRFTSKCLESQYLDGIDKNNLEQVYQWLINTNFVKTDIDTFLTNSNITNLDFKIDSKLLSDLYFEMLSYYQSICKLSSKLGKGKKRYESGVQFGDKKNTFLARPSFRVYHKERHIIETMTDFYDSFLTGEDVTDLVRCEMNLKNAKHLKHFGIEKNSLNDICSIPQETRKEIMIKGINSHFDLSLEQKRSLGAKINTKDLFVQYLISKDESFDLDAELEKFYWEYGLEGEKKRKCRERLKKRIKETSKQMIVEGENPV